MLKCIVCAYAYMVSMKEVRFWINDKEHEEALRKIGKSTKESLYGFAKRVFLEALENVE